MIDLSFLTEAEQEAILKVLQRDAELKKVEEDRIRHLQDAVDEHELKYKSGQWFYEAKSKRHSDKIHGADLVRASIRKRKKPATIELVGVLEEPEEVIEDLKLAKVEKSQSARKVSFLAPDKDKHTLMNGSASPIKLRKNPFNSENAGLDVTDIGDVKHTLENGLDLPKPDKMSSKVKFGVKLPYADLNGGSPISLKKTDASLKLSGEPPVPKPRTLLKNDQALDRSSSQAKREDSVNGTGRPRGILKRYSSSSSTDSENIRLAHPIESCRIALPGSPILEVQKESAIADANGSLDSDRFKHVRFSSKVLQKTPPQSPEPFGGNEMNEFRILDQGLSNTQLDPSATDGLPSRNPKAVGLDVPQVNPSVTTSTLSSTSLGSDVDVLDSTLSEKPSLDKNLTLQTNIATGPEHIYAVVKKQPKIPSAVEIPEYMRPSSREPRFIGQEGTPLEFGKSYGGGGKTNYSPSYPVPSPEHLAVLSEEQPKYNFHKKPGDDKEGLNPQSGNFKVLPIKDRIETSEVMSNPSEYQNLKSYWNFDGRSPLAQETKPSPGKLQDTILYRSWQRKDVDHRDSKEPSENNLLPNTFDLSEEEQSSHKVATWLAQSSNLYEPLYTEDPGNASEETEDVSSIPKEEQNCPEDLYEKPVVNSVMLESNPPKTSIHEEPPRQVGFIGFEQMENPGNQHVAEEVIERTAVAKSDNQEFISALQKLEIEASQTEETHEPNASDASSTQSEEEAPSIVEEEITKDAVDTEKNSSDFYNRLLELEAEYKRDPDPEEPEDFATNDIKVSQFPNKEVFISKKVYSSVEFVPSDGILSTDHSGSGSTDMNKERSLLDSYIKSAAKYQSKSPGIYENNMGNGLNYKPEIDIPDVPKPNAVILKQGKPAQVAIPHETESFKPDKYSIEVMKAKDESISKVLDWFSRSSESTDETPPINVLESKPEKNGLPFYNRRGVIKKETGTNLENSDPVNVANEKIPNLEAPMVVEEPKAMDRPTSDSNIRVHSHSLNDDLSLSVSLDSLSTVRHDVLNAQVSNVDPGEPFGHGEREHGQVIHQADQAEKDIQFQDLESHESCKTEDIENVAETKNLLVEKASVVRKGAVHAEEQTPEFLNSRAFSTVWRKPGILQKTESEHFPNLEFKESNALGGGISDQELGGQSSPLRSTISKANDAIDGSRENPVTGDYTETCGKGSLHGSDDGESLFATSTTCATDGTEQAPELDTEEFSIAWRKPGTLENPEYVEQPESHEPTVCVTDHDLELEGGKPSPFIFSKPALKRDAHVISPSDILETTEDRGTDSLIDNEDQGNLVTFKKVTIEGEEPSPSISQLRSFWENGRVESVKERKVNNQTKLDPFIIEQTSSTELLKGEEPQDKLSSTNEPNKLRKRHTFHHFFDNDGATETNTPCVRSVSVSEGTSQDQSMPKSTFQNVRNFWNFDEKFKVGNVEKLDNPSTIQTRAVGTATLKNKKTILLNDKDLDCLDGVESTKSDMKQNFNQIDPRSEATVSSQPDCVEKPAENNYTKNVTETTHRLVVPRTVVDLHGMLQKLKNEISEESPVSAEYNLEPISQDVHMEEFAQVQNMEHAGVEDDGEHMKGQSSVTRTKVEILEVIDNPILLKPQSSSFSLRLQSLYNEYSKCRTRSGELAGADDHLPGNESPFGGYSTKVSVGSLNRSDITDQNISSFLDCKDEACVSSDQQMEMEDASMTKSCETDSPRLSQNQDLALPKLAQPSPTVRKVVSEIVIKSHVSRKGVLSEFNIKLRKLKNELVEEHKDESEDRLQNKLDGKDHLSQNDSQNVNEEQGHNSEVKVEKLNPVEIDEIVEKSHNSNKTESFNKGLEKLANECKEIESYNNSNCNKNAPNHVPSIENQIVDEKVEKTVLGRKCFSSFDAGLEKLHKELIDEAIVAREKHVDPKVFEEPECEMQPFDRSIQTSIDSITNFQPAALNFSLKSFENEDLQSQEYEPLKPSTVRSFIEISKAYVPQKSRLIEIKPEHNETDFTSTNPAPLNLKTSNTESIPKPIKLNFESLAPQKNPNLNVTLEKETSPSVADVESSRQTTKESVDMPQRQNKKEMLEKAEKPVVLPRTRFNYFDSGLLKLYKESMDPSNHLQMSDSIMTQDGTQQDAGNLPKEGVSLPADLRPNEDVEANLDLYHTMQATEGQRSERFPSGINKEDVTEQINKTAAPTREPFAKRLEKLQKELIEESSSIGNTLRSEPNPLQRPSISMEMTGSDTPTGDTMVDVRTFERRTWRGLSQDEEKPSPCYKPLDSSPVMPNCSSTPINQSNASLRKSTLKLFLETPYRREMSKSVDFVLTGYVASEDGQQQSGSINPILSALKRSEAKAICKPVLDVTPTIPNEDEADKLKEQLEREIPIDTDLQESQFKNPEKLKQLSKSVPAFLHDETDGKDTDSASESSFPIGKHKKSPSSLTDLSGSSGMASMSSVSGSVMSVYSGDFGNVDVKGTIQFAVDYVDQLKEFHVFVSQCKDLAIGDVKKQRSDPYVKSYLYPEKAKMGKRKTAVKKKTLNPAYNEILRYKISKDTLLTQSLNLSVWHNDALGRNSFLGEVELPLDQWDWNNKQMNWYPLQPRTPAAGVGLENRGEIKLSLKYVPQSESGGKSSQTGEVHIWIKDCNQLPQLRGNKINSFVKCTILPDTSRKSRQKTRTVDKTPNPIFNHTMVYDGFKEEDLKEACVELTVWDHNKLTNHFLGGLRIGLGTGKSYGTAVDWMDSTTDESSMWEKMIKNSNVWADGVLPLRMLKMAKITK
uniref:Synaptotagmin-like protein 2 n=1 Tax=Leptobrachium leishanense TaxID=445787 RepID=A0A8C5LZG5_9ANUR